MKKKNILIQTTQNCRQSGRQQNSRLHIDKFRKLKTTKKRNNKIQNLPST